MKLLLPTLLLACLVTGCSFHSSATRWNGRVGPDGEPIFVKSTTNVGLNLLIMIKVLGATDKAGMIDELTSEIAEEGGDYVRVIETSTENYWYGFPPFTWIFTPVITTAAADYRPSQEEFERARAEFQED